jgi:hypothetical protein
LDNFVTLDYLGTFAGMVAVIVLITQFTKDLVDKISGKIATKYLVFTYSMIVLVAYQVMTGTFELSKVLLTIINAMLLTMTAQGGYEWVFKPIEQKRSIK